MLTYEGEISKITPEFLTGLIVEEYNQAETLGKGVLPEFTVKNRTYNYSEVNSGIGYYPENDIAEGAEAKVLNTLYVTERTGYCKEYAERFVLSKWVVADYVDNIINLVERVIKLMAGRQILGNDVRIWETIRDNAGNVITLSGNGASASNLIGTGEVTTGDIEKVIANAKGKMWNTCGIMPDTIYLPVNGALIFALNPDIRDYFVGSADALKQLESGKIPSRIFNLDVFVVETAKKIDDKYEGVTQGNIYIIKKAPVQGVLTGHTFTAEKLTADIDKKYNRDVRGYIVYTECCMDEKVIAPKRIVKITGDNNNAFGEDLLS
jgi:hypothetical protein